MFAIDSIITDRRVQIGGTLILALFFGITFFYPLFLPFFLVLLAVESSLLALYFFQNVNIVVKKESGERYFSLQTLNIAYGALPLALFLTFFWVLTFVFLGLGLPSINLDFSIELIKIGFWGIVFILTPVLTIFTAILVFDHSSRLQQKFIFQRFTDLVLFYLTALTVIGFMIGATLFQTYSPLGFFVGLLLLPAFLYVGYVEGRFQPVFLISSWYKFKGWDIIQEQSIEAQGIKDKIKSVFEIKDIVFLPIAIVALGRKIAISSGLVSQSNDGSGGLLFAVLLGLGASLTLLVHPRKTLETWGNQGLYSKIFSGFDYYDAYTYERVYGVTNFIPKEEEVEENKPVFTFMGLLIISVLGLQTLGETFSALGGGGLIWEISSIITLTFSFSFAFGLISSLLLPSGLKDLVAITDDSIENQRDNFNQLIWSEELSITGNHSEIRSSHRLASLHKVLNNSTISDEDRYPLFRDVYNDDRALSSEHFISFTELCLIDVKNAQYHNAVDRCISELEETSDVIQSVRLKFILVLIYLKMGELEKAWDFILNLKQKNLYLNIILEGIAVANNQERLSNHLPLRGDEKIDEVLSTLSTHFKDMTSSQIFLSYPGYISYVLEKMIER